MAVDLVIFYHGRSKFKRDTWPLHCASTPPSNRRSTKNKKSNENSKYSVVDAAETKEGFLLANTQFTNWGIEEPRGDDDGPFSIIKNRPTKVPPYIGLVEAAGITAPPWSCCRTRGMKIVFPRLISDNMS